MYLLAVLLVIAVAAPVYADTIPRYSQRRVYGVKPGPRAVLVALPGVKWSDLRSGDTPHLQWLLARGAAGLMPAAEPALADPNRTWVSLGAGRNAAGGPRTVNVARQPGGQLIADITPVWEANKRRGTRAQPGLLGADLQEHGLTTFVLTLTQNPGDAAAWPAAAALMNGDGGLSGGLHMPYRLAQGADGLTANVTAAAAALQLVLPRYDVVLISLGDVTAETAPRGRSAAPDWARQVRLHAADELVGQALRLLEGYDGFLALLVPEAAPARNPVTTKSLGAVVLYQTKRPESGILYTDLTRWPGIITAADFAPTFLDWWGVDMEWPNRDMDGRVLSVRPGSPSQLDQLDRMLSNRYRWGFAVAGLNVLFILALLAAAAIGLRSRPDLLPRLRAPALAAPLIPVGVALAGLTGTGSGIVYLGTAAALTVAGAIAASRLRRPLVGLAVAMLTGAAVFVADVLTGAWLSRTSAYSFPVITSARFYGIGNEYMGYLLGMTAIGLGALWQLFPWRRALFAIPAAVVVLVVGAPAWGANWGGAFSVAAGCLIVWLLAVPQDWRRAVPISLGVLLASLALPAALDLVANGTLAHRSHIGLMASALLSGDRGALADIVARKAQMALRILLASPWALVLAAGTAAVLRLLLREGAPARLALRRLPLLAAGLVGALGGGVVAMLVNDSGAIAGAGAICAALATSIFLTASAPEAER